MVIFLIPSLPHEIVLGPIISALKLFHIFIFDGVFSHPPAPPEIALEAIILFYIFILTMPRLSFDYLEAFKGIFCFRFLPLMVFFLIPLLPLRLR